LSVELPRDEWRRLLLYFLTVVAAVLFYQTFVAPAIAMLNVLLPADPARQFAAKVILFILVVVIIVLLGGKPPWK